MNLYDFDKEVSKDIRDRGLDYFMDNRVDNVVRMTGRRFAGEVAGSEVYDVDCKLDEKGEILYSYCSCPYHARHTCQHEVAFYLSLRDQWEIDLGEELEEGAFDLQASLMDLRKTEVVNLLTSFANKDAALYEELRGCLVDGRFMQIKKLE